ncbi:MAG: hypothetical protein EZS28_045438, partial [Streblomastix strix]
LILNSDKVTSNMLSISLGQLAQNADNNVILYAIKSIFNILGFGAKQASSSSQYPQFETISAYGGVDKLYSVLREMM